MENFTISFNETQFQSGNGMYAHQEHGINRDRQNEIKYIDMYILWKK